MDKTIVARNTSQPPQKPVPPKQGAWRAMLNLHKAFTDRLGKSDERVEKLEATVKAQAEQIDKLLALKPLSLVIDAAGNLIQLRADGTKENLGRVVARDGQDVDREELDQSIKALVDAAVAAIPKPQDGASVKIEDVRPLIEASIAVEVAKIRVPEDGKPADPEETARLVEAVVAKAVAAIPVPKDGNSVDPKAVEAMVADAVAKAVAQIRVPEDGEDADPKEVERLVELHVARAIAQLPKPKDGESVSLDDVRPALASLVTEAMASVPKPKDGESVDPAEVDRIINDRLAAAIAALPKPENGVGISEVKIENKALIVTLTNGEKKSVGRVVGRDGENAKTPTIALSEPVRADIRVLDLDQIFVRNIEIDGVPVEVLTRN